MAISAQLNVQSSSREATRKIYAPKGGKRDSLPRVTARQMRQMSDRIVVAAKRVDRKLAQLSDRIAMAKSSAERETAAELAEKVITTKVYRREQRQSELVRHLYRAGICLLVGLLTAWPISANFRAAEGDGILGLDPILFTPPMVILVVPLLLWCVGLLVLAGHQFACAVKSATR